MVLKFLNLYNINIQQHLKLSLVEMLLVLCNEFLKKITWLMHYHTSDFTKKTSALLYKKKKYVVEKRKKMNIILLFQFFFLLCLPFNLKIIISSKIL